MKEMNKQKIHNKNSLGLKMLALAVLPVLALGIVLLGVGMHAFSKSMENHVQKDDRGDKADPENIRSKLSGGIFAK